MEEDKLAHHQDPDTLVAAMCGQLKHYHYDEDETFYQWAQEGRLVTRVIDIMPGNLDDKMKIGIRVVDLKDSVKYTALSYTWKETVYERSIHPSCSPEQAKLAQRMAKFLHAVYCNSTSGEERFLEVNCGLRDALRRVRHQSDARTFWIDQLSINQQDLQERAYQVRGMRSFFNGAREVVLWVGEEEEDTHEVFAVLEKISDEFKRQDRPPDLDRMMIGSESVLPSFESTIWTSLLNLFDRPVFNRCWVIQEVVAAQKIVLHCGNFSIVWADLARVAITLSQRPWLMKLPQDRLKTKYTGLLSWTPYSDLDEPKIQTFELPGFNNVIIMNELRDNFHCSKRATLTSLLFHTFPFEASDPRDKIYSILGIRIANNEPGHQHDIKADYELPVEEVFTNAAKACILEESSFTICGINNGISSKKMSSLPTWVPDLTAKSIDFSGSLCQPNTPNPYHACGDVPLIAAWPYEDRPDLLVTSSCKVETIVSVSEHSVDDVRNLPTAILEWSRMASLIGPRYPNGEFAPDAFGKTCVADVLGPLRHYPLPDQLFLPLCRVFETLFHRHLAAETSDGNKGMDEALEESANEVIATLIAEVYKVDDPELVEAVQNEESSTNASESSFNRPQLDAQDMALYNVALEAMLLACKNRRFFVTSNNFFGISSKDIKPGDEVQVLSGTVVPFVLRRVSADSQSAKDSSVDEQCLNAMRLVDEDGLALYQMMGECYIHGFMQGEICTRENASWDGICIV